MRPINRITITGRAGGDAEFRATPSGREVTNVSLCHERTHFDQNAQEWVTDNLTWWHVAVWDKRAKDIADTIRKGDLVMVTGRAELREFTRRDGTTGHSLDILADHVAVSAQPSGRTTNDGGQSGERPAGHDDPWRSGADDDNPPF